MDKRGDILIKTMTEMNQIFVNTEVLMELTLEDE